MKNPVATTLFSHDYHTANSLKFAHDFCLMVRSLLLMMKPVCVSATQAPGLWQIYDTEGNFFRLEEAALESPLINPTDLVLLAAGAFRIFLAGRALLQSGVRAAVTVNLSHATISLLRGRLKIGLSARSLKMTESAAKHMYELGRYVPLQIQEKAIRYGTRMPDPLRKPELF